MTIVIPLREERSAFMDWVGESRLTKCAGTVSFSPCEKTFPSGVLCLTCWNGSLSGWDLFCQ